MKILALIAARLARSVLHILGRGGTALPGKLALKLCPDILSKLGKNVQTVLVTGTNGKSTTVGMLRHMADAGHLPYISNKSGANVISGITSDFIFASSLLGKPNAPLALMECDEIHLSAAAKALQPKAIVITNLFDDQVDRLGGAMETRQSLIKGIQNAPNAILCLNADDPISGSIGQALSNPCFYYGVDDSLPEKSANRFQPNPESVKLPQARLLLKQFSGNANGSQLSMQSDSEQLSCQLALPAFYNAYNALSALSAAKVLDWNLQDSVQALSSFQAVFGRMEQLTIQDKTVEIILVKNPAGFNRALEFAQSQPEAFIPVFGMNNRTGDGKDFTWIEDVNFEAFFASRSFPKVYVFGDCREQTKARLCKAGVNEDSILLLQQPEEIRQVLQETQCPLWVFPNYTAMLSIREILASLAGEKKFWE